MKTSLLGLCLVLCLAPGAVAQTTAAPSHSLTAIAHDQSPPLRDLVSFAATPKLAAAPAGLQINGPDTGLSLVTTFPGIATPAGFNGTPWATDASGAAGPDHYMQSVNFSAAIYDKSGNLVMGPFSTATFWDGFSAPCGGGWTDVIVLYDKAAQRWFVSRFARQNSDPPVNWYQCFAISTTSDPTGTYNRYAFLIDADEFNDYPKFGIWPDAYYMTADRDKIFPGKGVFVAAFERSKMLANQPANAVITKIDNGGMRAGMLPADWDGYTEPPAGSPNYFVRTLDNNLGWPQVALEVWNFQVDWNAVSATFTLQNSLLPDAFNSALCALDQNCIPQPDTSQGLDPLAGGRPMFRLAYRNFGDHEALVFNQTVATDADNHAGVRWYELRRSGGDWSIYQQSTHVPDTESRWIGSAAMDQFGNMLVGYNVSGTNTYPSIRVAGRLASDPLNTLSDETTLQAGSGSQTGFLFWADYSQMTLDPLDDCTFWYVNAFQPTTSDQQSWATQIGAFRFPSCSADLAVTKTRSPGGLIEAGTNVTYTIDVTNNGPASAGNVTLQDPVATATTLVSFSAPDGWNCTAPAVGSSGMITCSKSIMANGESAQFTLEVAVPCSTADATQVNNTAQVSLATPADPDSSNDSQAVSFTVHNPAPIVTASLAFGMLPQNDHELVNVGLSASVTDGQYCPAPPLVTQVFGDEDDETPTGSGDVFSPDARDIGVSTLRLREERVATADGRVYLVVVKATDQAGASGFAANTVAVPKSSSPANISSVTAQAAAAKAFADANGGAPAGYVVIGDGPVLGGKQ